MAQANSFTLPHACFCYFSFSHEKLFCVSCAQALAEKGQLTAKEVQPYCDCPYEEEQDVACDRCKAEVYSASGSYVLQPVRSEKIR